MHTQPTKGSYLNVARWLLATTLLLSCTTLWATDADGDGVPDKAIAKLDVQNNITCALDGNGTHCWPASGASSTSSLVHPVSVSTGGSGFACALDDNGMQCWGYNGNGQTNVPNDLVNPIAASAGHAHTCALDDNGVHCWGFNGLGQTDVPNDLVNPVAIDAGERNTCAIDDTGVRCWGNDAQNQVSNVPNDLVNPMAVSVGAYHICALADNGVQCWGNGTEDDPLPSLVHPVAVSVGLHYACAIDDSGVQCWGGNTSFDGVSIPTLVNPVAVGVGDDHACALDDNGVHCWGNNVFGQTDVPAGLKFKADNCPHAANADQADGDGDGLGNACDPLVNDGVNLNIFNGKLKADKTGSVVAFAGDFDGDGFGDYVVGTPNYDLPAAPPLKAVKNAGKVEIISGNNGHALYSQEGTVAKEALGTAVTGNADVNGDGISDVVVGAPWANDIANGLKAVGSISVIYGCKGELCATHVEKYGTEAKAMFGAALAFGDVNNDGVHADVVVGSPRAVNAQGIKPLKQAGRVQVFSGANLSISLLDVYGLTAKAYAGTAVAAGDFDGFAGTEIMVGAPNDDDTVHKFKDTGSVRVHKYTGISTEPSQELLFYGAPKERLGQSVAAGADIDGDGVADVIVGAPGTDDPVNKKLKDIGAVWVFYGGGNSRTRLLPSNVAAKAGVGTSVALEYINGDSYADIIAGAPKGNNPTTLPKETKDTGSVIVWSGEDLNPLFTSHGDKHGDLYGASVSAGDINRDGQADIIIGSPGTDVLNTKLQKDAGKVKVINTAVL